MGRVEGGGGGKEAPTDILDVEAEFLAVSSTIRLLLICSSFISSIVKSTFKLITSSSS